MQGIEKPAFWAFKLLSLLGEERYIVPSNDGVAEYAVFKSGNALQILVYAQEFVATNYAATMSFMINNMPTIKQAQLQSITVSSGNPIAIYEAMGRPKTLKPSQVADIRGKSAVLPHDIEYRQDEDVVHVNLDIASNEVKLITLYFG